MKVAEVLQILGAMTVDPERPFDFTRLHALLVAIAIIRSLPKELIACMDILLDVEDTRPKP
jgi:hypothetical protein